MKYDLTKAQIEKINKAIELAQEPGACKYMVDGKPCCVIGQLAALEGVPAVVLDRTEFTVSALIKRNQLPEFASYPREFLYLLQRKWDCSKSIPIENARAEMHKFLDLSIGEIHAKLRELEV